MNRRVNRAALVTLGLLIALAIGVYQFPSRVAAYMSPVVARAQVWSDPNATSRIAAGPAPYDLLHDADAVLPRDARVLLVTDGSEVRGREYVTAHRAMYYL